MQILVKLANRVLRLLKSKFPEFYYSLSLEKSNVNWHSNSYDMTNKEPNFFQIASKVISEGRTMLKFDRLFTLYQIISQSEDNTIALEIGVYRGGTTKFLATLAA